MASRTKASQLHIFPIRNLLGIAIAPLHGHVRIRVRIDQYVERAGRI